MRQPTRLLSVRQDCRHSKEAFDAAFRCINQRRDISSDAKLVYAHLVTLRRTRRDATQTEIGDAIGCSRHQVWRAIGELVAAELVQTIRYGLGRPNGYVLLGIDQEDLDGRASGSRPPRHPHAGQPGASRAGTYSPKRRDEKNNRGTGHKRGTNASEYIATREGLLIRDASGRMRLIPRS